MKIIARILDQGQGPAGSYDHRHNRFYDRVQITAATVGRTDIFITQKANDNYDVRNIPWDGGRLPNNRGIRIHGIGAMIVSDIRADSTLLRYGAALSIEVEDGAVNPKMEPVLFRNLVAGGDEAVALDGAAAALEATWGQGSAGDMLLLNPHIDVNPGEVLRVVVWVPTALAAIEASTYVYAIIDCEDLRQISGLSE